MLRCKVAAPLYGQNPFDLCRWAGCGQATPASGWTVDKNALRTVLILHTPAMSYYQVRNVANKLWRCQVMTMLLWHGPPCWPASKFACTRSAHGWFRLTAPAACVLRIIRPAATKTACFACGLGLHSLWYNVSVVESSTLISPWAIGMKPTMPMASLSLATPPGGQVHASRVINTCFVMCLYSTSMHSFSALMEVS